MKNKILFSISVLVFSGVLFTSCSKYEEGPALSLRGKAARVDGEWIIEVIEVNGTIRELTDKEDYTIFSYEKNGAGMEKTEAHTWDTGGGIHDIPASEEPIEWRFNDAKDKFQMRYKDVDDNWMDWGTEDDDWSTIIRLANKEFWFKDVYDADNDGTDDDVITKMKIKE